MNEAIKQKSALEKEFLAQFAQCPGNNVTLPGGEELTIYEEPLIGFASAEDELFERYKDPKVIGPLFMGPKEWLPEARTVGSLFFPFTETVRQSNREDRTDPSVPWLYGRIEGQQFINEYMEQVKRWLEDQGVKACVPSSDGRFGVHMDSVGGEEGKDIHADSRWSERHAAYVCGLGTFGFSRGLITRKGMAGRLASVIVDVELTPDERLYTGVYDFCTKCGACAKRCPIGAITVEFGKNNALCDHYIEEMKKRYAPRYGCGKCQTGVPCEHKPPVR